MNELSITVNIADRTYKLTLDPREEEIVRKAGRVINEKVREFAGNYAFKDKQDLLAMVALQFTTSTLHYEETTANFDTQIKGKLLELDKRLSEHLSD